MAETPEKHNVFISWSGEPTRKVAEALREGLRWSMQNAIPFVSSTDIKVGDLWVSKLHGKFDLKAGIVLITPQNQFAPWILFESGALLGGVSKEARVYPILLGFPEGSASLPLAHPLFSTNYVQGNRDGFEQMFLRLATQLEDPRPEAALKTVFNLLWTSALGSVVGDAEKAIPTPTKAVATPSDEVLIEIRQALRQLLKLNSRGTSYAIPGITQHAMDVFQRRRQEKESGTALPTTQTSRDFDAEVAAALLELSTKIEGIITELPTKDD